MAGKENMSTCSVTIKPSSEHDESKSEIEVIKDKNLSVSDIFYDTVDEISIKNVVESVNVCNEDIIEYDIGDKSSKSNIDSSYSKDKNKTKNNDIFQTDSTEDGESILQAENKNSEREREGEEERVGQGQQVSTETAVPEVQEPSNHHLQDEAGYDLPQQRTGEVRENAEAADNDWKDDNGVQEGKETGGESLENAQGSEVKRKGDTGEEGRGNTGRHDWKYHGQDTSCSGKSGCGQGDYGSPKLEKENFLHSKDDNTGGEGVCAGGGANVSQHGGQCLCSKSGDSSSGTYSTSTHSGSGGRNDGSTFNTVNTWCLDEHGGGEAKAKITVRSVGQNGGGPGENGDRGDGARNEEKGGGDGDGDISERQGLSGERYGGDQGQQCLQGPGSGETVSQSGRGQNKRKRREDGGGNKARKKIQKNCMGSGGRGERGKSQDQEEESGGKDQRQENGKEGNDKVQGEGEGEGEAKGDGKGKRKEKRERENEGEREDEGEREAKRKRESQREKRQRKRERRQERNGEERMGKKRKLDKGEETQRCQRQDWKETGETGEGKRNEQRTEEIRKREDEGCKGSPAGERERQELLPELQQLLQELQQSQVQQLQLQETLLKYLVSDCGYYFNVILCIFNVIRRTNRVILNLIFKVGLKIGNNSGKLNKSLKISIDTKLFKNSKTSKNKTKNRNKNKNKNKKHNNLNQRTLNSELVNNQNQIQSPKCQTLCNMTFNPKIDLTYVSEMSVEDKVRFDKETEGVELEDTVFTQDNPAEEKKVIKCNDCNFKTSDPDSILRHVNLTHAKEKRPAKKKGADKVVGGEKEKKTVRKTTGKATKNNNGMASSTVNGNIKKMMVEAKTKNKRKVTKSPNNDSILLSRDTPLKKPHQLSPDGSPGLLSPKGATPGNETVIHTGDLRAKTLSPEVDAAPNSQTPGCSTRIDLKDKLRQYQEIEDIFGTSDSDDTVVINNDNDKNNEDLAKKCSTLEKRVSQHLIRIDELVQDNMALHDIKDQLRDQVKVLETELDKCQKAKEPRDWTVRISKATQTEGTGCGDDHAELVRRVAEAKKTSDGLVESMASLAGSNDMMVKMVTKLEGEKRKLLAKIPCKNPGCDQQCGQLHGDSQERARDTGAGASSGASNPVSGANNGASNSATGAKTRKICWFFNHGNRGCQWGAKCRDLHVQDDKQKLGATRITNSANLEVRGNSDSGDYYESNADRDKDWRSNSETVRVKENNLDRNGARDNNSDRPGARGANSARAGARGGRGSRARGRGGWSRGRGGAGAGASSNPGYKGNQGQQGNEQGFAGGAMQNPRQQAPSYAQVVKSPPPPNTGMSVSRQNSGVPPPMRVERSEGELERLLRQGGMTQSQRVAELREVARGPGGDQVQETLVNILQQNLQMVRALERWHGTN